MRRTIALLILFTLAVVVIYSFINSSFGLQLFSYFTRNSACGGFTGEIGANACPQGYRCVYPPIARADQQGVCLPL